MADAPKVDRFAPPLMQVFRDAFRKRDSAKVLDLRDESGNRVVSGRRGSPRRMASEHNLRQDLAGDLISLLNTVNLASAIDLEDFEHVQKSIINYGLHDLSSISIDEVAVNTVGDKLKSALTAFEPRLVAGTVGVTREGNSVNTKDLKVRFAVRAEMHATPVDVPLDFVAELELDSAKMKISKL